MTLRIVAPAAPVAKAKGNAAWKSNLMTNDKGKAIPSLANAMRAFRQSPAWQGVVAVNVFADRLCLRDGPPWQGGAFTARDILDTDFSLAAYWLQVEGVNVSSSLAAEAMAAVAVDNAYHPVRDYLGSLTWDGNPRIDRWLTTYLGAEPTPLNKAFGAKFLIAAVARVQEPGCKVDTVLVLEGPQDIGKSSTLAVLANGWFTDHMPELHSKDALEQLQGVWFVEFAEFDKLRGAEVHRAKAFITTATDRFRPSYGKVARFYPRQCVFAATVNPGASGYLTDETGARRYWTVACAVGWDAGRKVELDGLTGERDQLWAEAVERYRLGESWWLDTAETKKEQQDEADDRLVEDPWTETITRWLGGTYATGSKESCTMAEIMKDALDMPVENRSRADEVRVGKVMMILGWRKERGPRGGVGHRPWLYLAPPRSKPAKIKGPDFDGKQWPAIVEREEGEAPG